MLSFTSVTRAAIILVAYRDDAKNHVAETQIHLKYSENQNNLKSTLAKFRNERQC